MAFPYTFPYAFPEEGGLESEGPAVDFTLAAGEIHHKRDVGVSVSDDSGIAYERIEIHYPTGYYEIAYETGYGWGRFYSSSLLVLQVPDGPQEALAENAGPSGPGLGLTVYPANPGSFPTSYPFNITLLNTSTTDTETVTVTGRSGTNRLELASALVSEYPAGFATVRISGGTGIGGNTIHTFTLIRDLHWPAAFTVKVTATDSLGNVTPL